jgi:3-oxoadipate CoA-transferase, alpha subunit
MINKTATHVASAIGPAMDGATVMIGGFGTVGITNVLIDGLIAQSAKDLSVFLCSLLCSRA